MSGLIERYPVIVIGNRKKQLPTTDSRDACHVQTTIFCNKISKVNHRYLGTGNQRYSHLGGWPKMLPKFFHESPSSQVYHQLISWLVRTATKNRPQRCGPIKNAHLLIGIPSWDLTYPTWGKGKSSSKCHFWGDMLVPWRVNGKTLPAPLQNHDQKKPSQGFLNKNHSDVTITGWFLENNLRPEI